MANPTDRVNANPILSTSRLYDSRKMTTKTVRKCQKSLNKKITETQQHTKRKPLMTLEINEEDWKRKAALRKLPKRSAKISKDILSTTKVRVFAKLSDGDSQPKWLR